MDRAFKYYFGEKHDLKYMSEHGTSNGRSRSRKLIGDGMWMSEFLSTWSTWPSLNPIMENAKKAEVELEWEQFTPLVSFFTAQVAKEETTEFDLYSFSYRDILHNGTYTMEMPWLDEVSRMNPYTYNITMNTDTAKKKGLKGRRLICLESSYGT